MSDSDHDPSVEDESLEELRPYSTAASSSPTPAQTSSGDLDEVGASGLANVKTVNIEIGDINPGGNVIVAGGDNVSTRSEKSTAPRREPRRARSKAFRVIAITAGLLVAIVIGFPIANWLDDYYQKSRLLESIDEQMIVIAKGTFIMGLTDQHVEELLRLDPSWEKEFFQEETPAREIYLSDYEIGKHEISNWQYEIFRNLKHGDKHAGALGGPDTPVVNVSWDDAIQFCEWLTEISGQYYHLPTEAQWEKAARSVDGRHYPWGNSEPGRRRANYESSDVHLISVGSLPDGATKETGIMEMAGNAAEWCQDWYAEDHYSNSSDNPLGPDDGLGKVVRGGSWDTKKFFIRCTARSFSPPSTRSARIGFRVVRSLSH